MSQPRESHENRRRTTRINEGLEALADEQDQIIQRDNEAIAADIETLTQQDRDDEDNAPLPHTGGPVAEYLQRRTKYFQLTGFEESDILSLWRDTSRYIGRPRGKSPSITYQDSMLIYLIWMRTGLNFEKLSSILAYPTSTLRDALERIRPILWNMLRERWNPIKFRPSQLDGSYPNIALCIDSTSLEVNRPKARWDEAKQFFDAKNHIYALKVEVAVLAKAPSYAIFISPAELGSVHDYEYFKGNYKQYVNWLIKTPAETRAFVDPACPSWKVVADKAYIGPAQDTPGVVRICPKKDSSTRPLTRHDKEQNKKISAVRIKVEHHFGRMTNHFKLWKTAYQLDHRNFDKDFQIAAWLTNETIRIRDSEELDLAAYRKHLDDRIERADARHAKKKANYERYGDRKRQRIEQLNDDAEAVMAANDRDLRYA